MVKRGKLYVDHEESKEIQTLIKFLNLLFDSSGYKERSAMKRNVDEMETL
jgi:hypothetical protein